MTTRRRGPVPVLVALLAGLFGSRAQAPLQPASEGARAVGGARVASTATGERAAQRGAWLADRLMVRLAPGVSVDELALDHGLGVLRPTGPSGLSTLSLGAGGDLDRAMEALSRDARVVRVARSGRVRGAAAGPGSYQWHLPAVGVDHRDLRAVGVTVAVLDTGVAHAEGCAAVPGLEGVDIVAPLDLVGGSATACDDHQHGTHIASLIASRGSLQGVARGASLMPIKVLDAEDEGDEQALVDGILWAVEQGADVLNLSLSFDPEYVPSPELLGALREAHDAGVLMVAAAGNRGGDVVSWPAASPLVIAVGASTLGTGGQLVPAPYGDQGPEVDLLAPGGSLAVDVTADGRGDGVLAETIGEGDPETCGYWFYEGTSQAAALVSGAAAVLLANGAAPEDVLPTLQASARDVTGAPYVDGLGAGSLDLGAAVDLLRSGSGPRGRALHASVLPYLLRSPSGLQIVPSARVLVLDEDGAPVVGVEAVGRADGAGEARIWRCETDALGGCLVVLEAVDASDAEGDQVQAAWRFTVDAVVLDEVSASPTPLILATDALEALATGMAEAGIHEGTLAWSWDAGDDAVLGPLSEGLSVMEAGRAGASAPSALLITERLAARVLEFDGTTLDLSGSGVSTDALGITAERASGSGVSTDALGATDGTTRVSGSGVATDALGATALSIHGRQDGEEHGLSTENQPVFPGEPSAAAALEGTAIEDAFGLSGAPEQASAAHALGVLEELGLIPESEDVSAGAGEEL